MDISNLAWDKMSPLLLILFKRKDPNLISFGYCFLKEIEVNGIKNHYYHAECEICGAILIHSTHEDMMNYRRHMVNHLKESNLLPFI